MDAVAEFGRDLKSKHQIPRSVENEQADAERSTPSRETKSPGAKVDSEIFYLTLQLATIRIGTLNLTR